MKAAVVTEFGLLPQYAEWSLPKELGPNELAVDVVATGLHNRVRSQADGSHYTSKGTLPFVPGIDGVGRTDNGELRYFILPDTTMGSMAERTIIDRRRSVVLPPNVDPVQIAAAMNPAMSSWIALRRRISFRQGQKVLVLGATGNAGRMAIQIARHLGASSVTAVGRGAERLAALGADAIVALDGAKPDVSAALGAAGSDVDVVLDYLWGTPTHDALYTIIPNRADDSQNLSWVQIGSVAGSEAAIPSAALRATRLQIVGSGQGSVSTADIVRELAELVKVIHSDALDVRAQVVPLADVEQAWSAPANGDRIVLVP